MTSHAGGLTARRGASATATELAGHGVRPQAIISPIQGSPKSASKWC